ncbi:MAG: hypothetical protein PHW59_13190 [Desulfobacterales bacterium]|nr:hypothetical protein [Desulfobacterales bacterium]MDD3952068.1 hypothetical protein [Desulfobacterales bacterium]
MATINDLVLIHFEDKPLIFARIEDIAADNKASWYHVKLLLLQVPLQTVSWILKDTYINGAEFTMGGRKVRLEKIECSKTPQPDTPRNDAAETSEKKPKAKIISLANLKKQ